MVIQVLSHGSEASCLFREAAEYICLPCLLYGVREVITNMSRLKQAAGVKAIAERTLESGKSQN